MSRAPDAIDREWVRRSVTGPFSAVHPLFTRDGALDSDGIRNEIEHNLAAGSGAMLLTFGDSLHSLLTDAEIGDLLKIVVRHTRGRAMVVAADRQWWTGKEIEYADFALETGADVLMVLPPAWGASVTVDTLVEHYRVVAEHIPTMLVTALFATNHALGLEVVARLVDEVPKIVAIKDDVTGEFARRVAILAHERWAVFSGGMKQNMLDMRPYGCDGYMATYLHFRPEISHAFWRTVEAGDAVASVAMIKAYDQPWFDLAFLLPGNYDAMFHASQEIFGIGGRWRRTPYHSLTDGEMDVVRAMYDGLPRLEDVVPAYATGVAPGPVGRP